jgi:hypothetical protein
MVWRCLLLFFPPEALFKAEPQYEPEWRCLGIFAIRRMNNGENEEFQYPDPFPDLSPACGSR